MHSFSFLILAPILPLLMCPIHGVCVIYGFLCWLSIFEACTFVFAFCSTMAFLYIMLSFLFPYALKDYQQKHPEVTVLDPPAAIQHLRNRESMLQDVADLNLSDYHGNSHYNLDDYLLFLYRIVVLYHMLSSLAVVFYQIKLISYSFEAPWIIIRLMLI